jgi:hypothetical protein
MKEIVYQPGIRQVNELFSLVQQASAYLDSVVGRSADLVSAEWDRGEDAQGRAVVTLRLFDETGSVTGIFDPKELESPSQVRSRLLRLWGKLLQIQSHKQLEELMSSRGE